MGSQRVIVAHPRSKGADYEEEGDIRDVHNRWSATAKAEDIDKELLMKQLNAMEQMQTKN